MIDNLHVRSDSVILHVRFKSILLSYRNDPKFLDRQVLANSLDQMRLLLQEQEQSVQFAILSTPLDALFFVKIHL